MTERPILFSAPMVRALLAGTKTQTRRALKPQPDHRLDYQPRPVTSFMAIGTETATGRLVMGARDMSGQPVNAFPAGKHGVRDDIACPYGKPGDHLWVRETFSGPHCMEATSECASAPPSKWGRSSRIWYWADGNPSEGDWRPSIHMPRWASRIDLEITEVRVQRLQDISEADAIAEGCSADTPQVWWQGYKDCGEKMGLVHQQATGAAPPDWMIEPHKMAPTPWLERSAVDQYRALWEQINGPGSWDANPYVWAVSFRKLKP